MNRSRLWAALLPMTLILTAGACQSTGSKKTTRKKPAAELAVVADRSNESGQYRDPLARATLREKALGLLGASAFNGAPEERVNAIEALQVSPARLFPLLDNALVDPNIAVRAVSAMTVGRVPLNAAADKVIPLLDDSSAQVRASALYALKRCGRPVDLTPLAGMLADPDLRVRSQAAFLLGELGDASALGLLRDAAQVSPGRSNPGQLRVADLQIAEARIKLGDEVPLQEVRAALFPAKPEDLEATALACQIAGQVQDKASVNRLIVLTAAQDENKQFMPAEVRLSAAAALAKLGQPQGSYIAEQYRTNSREPLRAQSAFVFGETRKIENLHVLSEMMNDSSGRVRVAAAAAIVKITDANGGIESAAETRIGGTGGNP